MADDTAPAGPGPTINPTVNEVQGVFPSDAMLQNALSKLTLIGLDRADFSLPRTEPAARDARPEAGAENPDTDTDNRQMRTMHTSMAGAAGAMAAAGAVVATGGAAAVAAAAAVAVGAGAGLAANAASSTADAMQHEERETLAREGRLVLAVRLADPAKQGEIERIMRDAGASRVQAVSRTDNVISSAGWTGL
jgi:hypothetical protein